MKRTFLALAALGLLAGPALADQAAADQCAAGLDADAKTVYAATASGFAGASDKRAYMTDKVRGLVMSGSLSRGTARSAAEAASTCLSKL